MSATLLPINSTPWERCIAAACEFSDEIDGAISEISRAKHVTRPVSFLPWLIDEYGLGELSPYVPNLYDLLDEGIQWQRIRGSLASIDAGLNWIGYSATFKTAWPERAWWNSFQLCLDQLPAADAPDLERIEGITDLSKCARSDFRRAVYQYDAGALEADGTPLDHSMLERESGVIATEKNTLWSFSRTTEISHVLTKKEGEAIGNWMELVGGEARWVDMHYPWTTSKFPWLSVGERQRQTLMSAWFEGRILYAVLRRADNSIIGYRRCRAVHAVEQEIDGVYNHSSAAFQPSIVGTAVYIEAMTDFAEADAVEAKTVSILIHAQTVETVPPGRLWFNPDDLVGGVEIIKTPIAIPLRHTVRDQFKFLLRF